MRAHSQTMDHRSHVGVTIDVGGPDWFHRLCLWFKTLTYSSRAAASVNPYGTWDAQRERFRPMHADSAADMVVSQNGAAWAERIYSASI
jgi:hypothetical protein